MNGLGGNCVLSFAVLMQEKLNANSHKSGWEDCDYQWLLDRTQEEIKEVVKAINQNRSWRVVAKECADVANFMMMIADNYEQE